MKCVNKIIRLLVIQIKYLYNIFKYRKGSHDGKVTCVIFSRDRALQLEALLESLRKYSDSDIPVIVQFSCSPRHEPSYNELINKYCDIVFVREDCFRTTLISIIKIIKSQYLFFLVDDQIFIRHFRIEDIITKVSYNTFASLRLGKNITNWGIEDIDYNPIFEEENGYLIWKFNRNRLDFGYQFSVDATIYRTIDIVRCTMSIPFKAPNSYESNMNSVIKFKLDNRGVAYSNPVVINLIINASRIESDYEQCESGEYTPDEMLQLKLEGRKFDLDKISSINYNSTHHIIKDINSILKLKCFIMMFGLSYLYLHTLLFW